MNQLKKKSTLIIILTITIICLTTIAIANIGKNKDEKVTSVSKCPYCGKTVQELTEYNICEDCYTYFMGLNVSEQQQWLTYFKDCYNKKGEKIK